MNDQTEKTGRGETDHEAVIQRALARVNAHAEQGDLPHALGVIEALLPIDDAWLLAGPLSAIENLIHIASSLLATQAYREIEPLFGKAINALQAHPDTQPKDYIIPMNNLMVLYENMGNRQAVNQIASSLVNVASQITEPIDANIAQILIRLGTIFQGAGETQAVRILYRQVNNYMASDSSIDPKVRYDWYMMYASFFQQAGEPGHALEILEQADSFSAGGGVGHDARTRGNRLNAIGGVALAANEFDKADQYLSLAIKHLAATGMENSPEMSIACHNLASTILAARLKARYAEASELMLRSLSIVKAKGHAESAEYAGGLGLMANIAVRRGDSNQAQRLYSQAFAIYEAAADTNHDEYANYLTDAGCFFLDQTNLKQAERLFGHALNLREASSSPNNGQIAKALSNLALVHFKKNELTEAIDFYTRATDLRHQELLDQAST